MVDVGTLERTKSDRNSASTDIGERCGSNSSTAGRELEPLFQIQQVIREVRVHPHANDSFLREVRNLSPKKSQHGTLRPHQT